MTPRVASPASHGRGWLVALWAVLATGCLDPIRVVAVTDTGSNDSGSVRFVKDTPIASDIGRLGSGDVDAGSVPDVAEVADGQAVEDGQDGQDVADAPDDAAVLDAEDATPTDSAEVLDASDDLGLSDAPTVDDAAADALAEDAMLGDAEDGADAADDAVDATEEITETTCGNGACDLAESCSTCAADCGACSKPLCEVLGAVDCAAGQQCFPNGNDVFCAKAGSLQPSAACTFYNDCAVGALCAAGSCRTLCDFSGKDAQFLCKPGVPCEKLLVGSNPASAKLGVCKPSANCDPLSDAGCGGNSCVANGWLKTCVKPGAGGAGAPCQGAGDCLLGNLCDTGTCRAKCDTQGGAPACSKGSCLSFKGPDGNPVPGFVGTCH